MRDGLKIVFVTATLLLLLAAGYLSTFAIRFLEEKDPSWIISFFVVLVVCAVGLAAIVVNYHRYIRYVPMLLCFLMAQTGFSYQIKSGVLTSANELLTIILLLIYVVMKLGARRPLLGSHSVAMPIRVYLALALVGVVFASFFSVAYINVFDSMKSYVPYVFYLVFIPECLRDEQNFDKSINCLVLFSLIPIAYSLYDVVEQSERYSRTLASQWGALNILVGYLLPVFFVCVGVFFHVKNRLYKILLLLVSGFIVYLMLLAQTRSGWAALIFSCGVFFFYASRKLLTLLPAALLAGLLFFTPVYDMAAEIVSRRIVAQTLTPDNSLRERFARWSVAWATVTTYPLTGSGWGGFLPVQPDGSAGDQSLDLPPRWHSVYLEILSQLGFPGLFVFLWLWFVLLKVESRTLKCVKSWREQSVYLGLFAGAASCLVYGFAEQQFYRIELASFTYFVAGLLIAKGNLVRQALAREGEKLYEPA